MPGNRDWPESEAAVARFSAIITEFWAKIPKLVSYA